MPSTISPSSVGTSPPWARTHSATELAAPLRSRWPSSRSTPDIRVVGGELDPVRLGEFAGRAGAQPVVPAWRTRRSSGPPASRRRGWTAARRRPALRRDTPVSGTKSAACRLPSVMVPVLSSSSVLTSPAASTARPDMASTLRCTSRSMPAMPMADSSAPIVVGIRQTSSETITMPVTPLAVERQGVGDAGVVRLGEDRQRLQGGDGEHEDDRQRGQQDVQRDLVRRLLPVGALDERDHPVDEALAGLLGDLDDDAVGQHGGAAGDRGAVAAGLADHRRGFAGDRRFVHRGNAFHDIAVTRDDLPGLDDDDVALLQQRRGDSPPRAGAPGAQPTSRRAMVSDLALRSVSACALPRPSATASARLAKSDGQPQPDHDQPGEPASGRRSPGRSLQTAPISTMNITGLRHRVRGSSLRSASGSRLPQHLRVEQAALDTAFRPDCRSGLRLRGGIDCGRRSFSGFLQREARARAWAGR